MDPELVQRVHGRHAEEHQRGEAEDRQRQVEDPGEGALEGALAQGDRQVELLALVVDDVGGPERVDLVAGAVEPVVEEVLAEKARDPYADRGARQVEHTVPPVEEEVTGEERGLDEDLQQLLQDPAAEVADRVAEAVVVPLLEPRDRQLQRDQQEEDRDGEDDIVHGVDRPRIVAKAAGPRRPGPAARSQ